MPLRPIVCQALLVCIGVVFAGCDNKLDPAEPDLGEYLPLVSANSLYGNWEGNVTVFSAPELGDTLRHADSLVCHFNFQAEKYLLSIAFYPDYLQLYYYEDGPYELPAESSGEIEFDVATEYCKYRTRSGDQYVKDIDWRYDEKNDISRLWAGKMTYRAADSTLKIFDIRSDGGYIYGEFVLQKTRFNAFVDY